MGVALLVLPGDCRQTRYQRPFHVVFFPRMPIIDPNPALEAEPSRAHQARAIEQAHGSDQSGYQDNERARNGADNGSPEETLGQTEIPRREESHPRRVRFENHKRLAPKTASPLVEMKGKYLVESLELERLPRSAGAYPGLGYAEHGAMDIPNLPLLKLSHFGCGWRPHRNSTLDPTPLQTRT